MALGACSQAEEADQPPPETVAETVANSAKSETSEEPPEVLSPRSPQTDAEKALDQALQRLGDDFEGEGVRQFNAINGGFRWFSNFTPTKIRRII